MHDDARLDHGGIHQQEGPFEAEAPRLAGILAISSEEGISFRSNTTTTKIHGRWAL